MDSIGNGKKFIYRKNVPGEYYFVEMRLLRESGVTYQLQETYDSKEKNSSEKYVVTKEGLKLVEYYLYERLDTIKNTYQKNKAEISESRNLPNPKHRGSIFEMEILTSTNFKGKMTAKQTFIREGKISLNGQEVDVLVFSNEINAKAWYRFFPFFSTKTFYTGEAYYGRGRGLVKFSMHTDTEHFEWTIKEVKDIE